MFINLYIIYYIYYIIYILKIMFRRHSTLLACSPATDIFSPSRTTSWSSKTTRPAFTDFRWSLNSGEVIHMWKNCCGKLVRKGNKCIWFGHKTITFVCHFTNITSGEIISRNFQTRYFWPSNCWAPENTDYAVYLCKRTMQNKVNWPHLYLYLYFLLHNFQFYIC